MEQLTAALAPGRAAFNRGQFWDAHELWEDVWRTLRGDERLLVQGLIQIAAGLHHLQNHRPRPAASLLGKGLQKLARPAGLALTNLPITLLLAAVEHLMAGLAASDAKSSGPITITL